MPIELNSSGFLGSVTYSGRSVKLKGRKFSDVVNTENKGAFLRYGEAIFHSPKENFVEKSTHCLDRQMCAFFVSNL